MDTTTYTKGNFLNSDTCNEGDIVEIIDEGVEGEIKQKDGSMKKVLNISVKTNDNILIYTPANKSMKKMQIIFGSTDSNDWIGKKFSVHFVDMEIAGKEMKVLRPKAIEEKK